MCIEWWVGSSLARECSIHRLPLLSPPSHAYWVPTSCFPIIVNMVVLFKMVTLYGEFSSFLARLVNRAASSHFFWWKQFLIRRQKQEGDNPLLGFKHKSRMDDICKVGICPPPLVACHLTSCLCNLSDACETRYPRKGAGAKKRLKSQRTHDSYKGNVSGRNLFNIDSGQHC